MSRMRHSLISVGLSSRYRLLTVAAAILLLVSAAAIWGGAVWATAQARTETDLEAAVQADKHARLLASALQKFRLLPLVLSEYPDVHAVLDQSLGDAVERLNGKLELLADRTDAAAIYVVAPDGQTLAASNWREPGSFVGQNFSYRPYVRDALTHGEAELFAVGSVTGRPGFFIARRISAGSRVLGVIVVKIDLGELEAQWAGSDGHTLLADAQGVVIGTDHDDWRFHTTRPLSSEEVRRMRGSQQFGALALTPLRFQQASSGDLQIAGGNDRYRETRLPTAMKGATLSFFAPLEPARARAAWKARLVVFAIITMGCVMFALLWRWDMGRLTQARARQALEQEVAQRTGELREANGLLHAESQRRLAADRRWRAASEELAQANRLGLIGQVTAGITHEINQPMAAIRAFADNARRYLDREQVSRVRDSLVAITDLTERIGNITTELRSFARRRTSPIQAIELQAALAGALLLIGDRIRAEGVTLLFPTVTADVRVIADRIRLEQVLINLIQNALEALRGVPEPRLTITTTAGENVEILIADNGPGLSAEISDSVFTPFVTSKPDGLGLGLGIARDIVREFGGQLEAVASPLGGAAFRISLRQA